jgi:hypothetical protein
MIDIKVQVNPNANDLDFSRAGYVRVTNQGFGTPAEAIAWIRYKFPGSGRSFHVATPGGWASWNIYLR